jgi:hypothetical protein
MCATLPMVFGGYFNLVRQVSEKSTGRVDLNLMDMFNMFTDLHQLQEIRRNGPKYTWTNKQKKPYNGHFRLSSSIHRVANEAHPMLCIEQN